MHSISTVLSVFLLLLVGYIARSLRILKTEDSGVLNSLVLQITMPAFVFDAIYRYDQPLPWQMVKIPIVGFGMIAVVLFLGYLSGRALKLDRPTIGGLILACGFGNTGFLGYPVTQSAFKDSSAIVVAAIYDGIAMALFLYTLGMFIAAYFSGEKVHRSQLTMMLKTPILWAIPISLALRCIHLPEFVLITMNYLARATVPVAMVSLGLVLSAKSMQGLSVPAGVVCALKLIALPILTYFAGRAAGMSGTILKVTVLESGMPTAAMACVVSGFFGANEKFVAGVTFVTTILSMVTIPIILYLLAG